MRKPLFDCFVSGIVCVKHTLNVGMQACCLCQSFANRFCEIIDMVRAEAITEIDRDAPSSNGVCSSDSLEFSGASLIKYPPLAYYARTSLPNGRGLLLYAA